MEEETETEIERVHAILGHALKRITQLEAVIANENQENTLDPRASVDEKNAVRVLNYVETNGKISTAQGKRLLGTRHHEVVHRAFRLLSKRFKGEMTITIKRRQSVLQYLRSPAQVHKLVHLKEIDWPK